MLITADSLLQKVSILDEYKELQGLEKQYSEIRLDFDPKFETKVSQMAKVMGKPQIQKQNDSVESAPISQISKEFLADEVVL